jgi:Mitochondrial carrier protein
MQAQQTSAVAPSALLGPVYGTLLRELGTSGAAVSVATFCTNPIDVVKVRVQLQPPSSSAAPSLVSTGSSIVRHEGATTCAYPTFAPPPCPHAHVAPRHAPCPGRRAPAPADLTSCEVLFRHLFYFVLLAVARSPKPRHVVRRDAAVEPAVS